MTIYTIEPERNYSPRIQIPISKLLLDLFYKNSNGNGKKEKVSQEEDNRFRMDLEGQLVGIF